MRLIEPYRLWIGHAGDARDFRAVLCKGIQAAVQLAIEEPPLVAQPELILFRIPLNDGSNDLGMLSLAVAAVECLIRSSIPTLVTCGAGMSRSPAVTAIVLARIEGGDAAGCLLHVTRTGPADVSASLWGELVRLGPS